ncbi:dityrosine synthesis enzyme [Ranunculus cassubicifolius]
MGLGAAVLTKTLTFAFAFSAFGDPIPWLIVLAFFFAKGFIKTGLGNRIAEALLAPAIPSVSARAGGIFLPLVKSLCVACGSNTSVILSSMFLTAMAANPLSANLTLNTIQQPITWTLWAKAAIVPGLVSLIVVPFLLYIIYPPSVKSSPDAPKLARERLEKMGPMTKNETIMVVTLLLTVGLWVFGAAIKVDAVTAAILGLSVLLTTGVVTSKECLGEAVASCLGGILSHVLICKGPGQNNDYPRPKNGYDSFPVRITLGFHTHNDFVNVTDIISCFKSRFQSRFLKKKQVDKLYQNKYRSISRYIAKLITV